MRDGGVVYSFFASLGPSRITDFYIDKRMGRFSVVGRVGGEGQALTSTILR